MYPCKYEPGKLNRVTFIKGGYGLWRCHQGPTLHQYEDGRIVTYWTAYNGHECDNDNVYLYSVSHNLGEEWSEPKVFMASPSANVSHLKIAQLKDGRVLGFYRETIFVGAKVDEYGEVIKWADYGRSICRIIQMESRDNGHTWTILGTLNLKDIIPDCGVPFYGGVEGVTQLKNGRVLLNICYLPQEGRYPQHFKSVFLYSEDEGETWRVGGVLSINVERGVMEPRWVELEQDHLICFIRNRSGYIYMAESRDGGLSWDRPKRTDLPSPESMCGLIALKSGRLLLVWNNVYSPRSQRPRYPLVAALSEDGGINWPYRRVLATESGNGSLSNFDLTQVREDGRILLMVTHGSGLWRPRYFDLDLFCFDEEWIVEGPKYGE